MYVRVRLNHPELAAVSGLYAPVSLCPGAEIYRIVSQKTALSPGEVEETIRPSGLEAINVKEGPVHQFTDIWTGVGVSGEGSENPGVDF
jgi:hypothetical protein